jgi:prepilin peptidase CpaA
MEKIWTIVKRLAREEEGMESVEYAVVGGLVIAATAAIWTTLGSSIKAAIQSLIDVMKPPAPPAGWVIWIKIKFLFFSGRGMKGGKEKRFLPRPWIFPYHRGKLLNITFMNLFLSIFLIGATIGDLLYCKIPNWLTYPGLAFGVFYFTITNGYAGFSFSVAGALVGFGLLLVPYIIGGTGAGDVKMLAAVGSFLGPEGVFGTFLFSCVVGGIYGLIVLAYNRSLAKTLKRYFLMIQTFICTLKVFYVHPDERERAYKVRYGFAIALGAFSYISFGV